MNRNWVVSLHYLRLYGFEKEMDFPFITEKQNSLFHFTQGGEISVFAPAFSADVTSKISLGMTLNIWNHSITQSSAYDQRANSTGILVSNLGLTSQFESRNKDEFEVEDGYSVIIGGMMRVNKEWTIGGVIKPSYRLKLDHRNTFSFLQTGQAGNISILEIIDTNAELRFPWIVGGGVAFRPNDPLTITMDVTWTQWSKYIFEDGNVTTNPLTGTDTDINELNAELWK